MTLSVFAKPDSTIAWSTANYYQVTPSFVETELERGVQAC